MGAKTRMQATTKNLYSATEAGEAINTQVLQNWKYALGENASKFLRKVSGIYFQEAPQLLRAIAVAVAKGDAVALKEKAHKLKSSSAALGARTLSQVCQQLESMGCLGVIPDAPEILWHLSAEYEKFKVALEIECQQWQ